MGLAGKVLKHSLKTMKASGIKGLANLVQQRASLGKKSALVKAAPSYIQIEPTLKCNLNCAFCSPDIRERTSKSLSLSEFKKILSEFPMLDSINLQGVGEPLLNPEFFEMVKYAKSRNIWVYSITNATILNESMARKLIESGIDVIGISLDGAKKETYESTRINANFEKVIGNIKALTDIIRETCAKKPEVLITVVATTGNIRELPDIIRLANDLGVKKVNIQNMHYWGSDKIRGSAFSEKSLVAQDLPSWKNARGIFGECVKIGKRLGVMVILPKNKDCFFPWTTCYVSVEGFITPCCIGASDPRIINFGNILEKPFSEIWNCEEYQKFRKCLIEHKPHPICKNCEYYVKK